VGPRPPPGGAARAFGAVVAAFDTVAAGVECLRPGLARCRARGPARWAGGEEQAASLLVEAIEATVGVECFVGIADGPLASTEAARAGRIIPSDDTLSFLGPLGLSSALGCVPTSAAERGRRPRSATRSTGFWRAISPMRFRASCVPPHSIN